MLLSSTVKIIIFETQTVEHLRGALKRAPLFFLPFLNLLRELAVELLLLAGFSMI